MTSDKLPIFWTLILISASLSLASAGTAQAQMFARFSGGFVKPSVSVSHSILVGATGQAPEPYWTQWLRADRMPSYGGQVVVEGTLTLCPAHVDGCSGGPAQGLPSYVIQARSRDAFFFELGHIFDWAYLTAADHTYLARMWEVPGWHWHDSQAGIDQGVEDGLEGTFAALYDSCASGQPTTDMSVSGGITTGPVTTPLPVSYTGDFDTCRYIKHLRVRVAPAN